MRALSTGWRRILAVLGILAVLVAGYAAAAADLHVPGVPAQQAMDHVHGPGGDGHEEPGCDHHCGHLQAHLTGLTAGSPALAAWPGEAWPGRQADAGGNNQEPPPLPPPIA